MMPQTDTVNGAPVRPVAIDHTDSPFLAPARWPVNPGTTFLNHGSYGRCPEALREAQNKIRSRMEQDPPRFFKVDLEILSDRSREALSRFIHAPATSIALVPNATFAVATVLHNAGLEAGDEVLVTDHEYDATMNELARIERRTGARVVKAHLPFPRITPDEVVERVLGAVTARTRLVVISHVTSASGLILPVERIVPEVRARGIDILVDGAHAPGHVPIDLSSLRPTFYAASCHKWVCSPKGSGFFYAEPGRESVFKPLALSCRVHEPREDRAAFLCDFDYVGTNDYSANLVIPEAIEHLGAQVPGSWPAMRERNHDLVVRGARLIAERAGLEPHAPEEMLGSMVSLRLPDDPAPGRPTKYDHALWDALMDRHRIQVPVWPFEACEGRVIRVSAHLYNTLEDFEKLAEALAEELENERRLGAEMGRARAG